MKIYSGLILGLISILFLSSCGPRQQGEEEAAAGRAVPTGLLSEVHQEFYENLYSLCGKSFRGEQIYRSHHASGWEEYEMIMHVDLCEPERILIPFHVGEDRSRTWMFLVEDGMLRLRHDHRHPDGTPEDETLYGGYADDTGTAFVQHFPADPYTAGLIEEGGGNVWTIGFDEALTRFTYRLERDGEKRLRVDFDLTEPL